MLLLEVCLLKLVTCSILILPAAIMALGEINEI